MPDFRKVGPLFHSRSMPLARAPMASAYERFSKGRRADRLKITGWFDPAQFRCLERGAFRGYSTGFRARPGRWRDNPCRQERR